MISMDPVEPLSLRLERQREMPTPTRLIELIGKLAERHPELQVLRIEQRKGEPLSMSYDPDTMRSGSTVEWLTTITLKHTVTQ